jgi:hypothetical protein
MLMKDWGRDGTKVGRATGVSNGRVGDRWKRLVWVGGPRVVLLWGKDELPCKQHGVFWTNSVFTLVG